MTETTIHRHRSGHDEDDALALDHVLEDEQAIAGDKAFRSGRGQRCGPCLGDLSCCVAMNGCEPWLNACPSAKRSFDATTGIETTRQVSHEQGRTWVSVSRRTRRQGYDDHTGRRPRSYWEDGCYGLPAHETEGELPDFPVHAAGVCEKCTVAWRAEQGQVAA